MDSRIEKPRFYVVRRDGRAVGPYSSLEFARRDRDSIGHGAVVVQGENKREVEDRFSGSRNQGFGAEER